MSISVIEQARAQAQVLVPLVKALSEPELGFLLICTADFMTAEGFGADVKLTRTQTIMQGADHCDPRYPRDADRSR